MMTTTERTSRLAAMSAVTMFRDAINRAELKLTDSALSKLAQGERYLSQADDEHADNAIHYREAAYGAIKIHCGIDPAQV